MAGAKLSLPVGRHIKDEPDRNGAKYGSAQAEDERGETAGFPTFYRQKPPPVSATIS